MIPLYDDNPTRRFTWLTVALVLANVTVFTYELSLPPAGLNAFIARWAFTPAAFFAAPTDPRQLITIITAAFMHGGWLHLGGNLLYLWIFGNNIEDRLGSWRFGLFYMVSAAVATFAQAVAEPGSVVPVVGASGAIAGILGAYLLLFPRARVMTLIPIFFYIELAAVPSAFVIGFWFVLQLVQGLGSIGAGMVGGVAWWAHIGGFVFGLATMAPVAAVHAAQQARRHRRRRR